MSLWILSGNNEERVVIPCVCDPEESKGVLAKTEEFELCSPHSVVFLRVFFRAKLSHESSTRLASNSKRPLRLEPGAGVFAAVRTKCTLFGRDSRECRADSRACTIYSISTAEFTG